MRSFNSVIIVLLLVCGCSRTTMRAIGEKHKAEIEAVLAELHTLAESIPQEDFDCEHKQLDVEPYMHVADRMSNTVMGSRDQFSGITKGLDDPTYFNMYTFAHEGLLGDRYLAQPGESTFEVEIQAFINLRYAIVYHPVDYRDAVITEKHFQIDPLKMVVAMYDRKAQKWLFAKTFRPDPPTEINVSYRDGQRESNAEFEVKNYFIKILEPQIAQYIESQVGGTIELDHDAYKRDGTHR